MPPALLRGRKSAPACVLERQLSNRDMQILFVHGMGATPFDCFPNLLRLRRLGYKTSSFSYFSSFQDLDSIKNRLLSRLAEAASEGDYALIGHSLGGILVRDILMKLPAEIDRPKHLFLLGSPMIATRMNKRRSFSCADLRPRAGHIGQRAVRTAHTCSGVYSSV